MRKIDLSLIMDVELDGIDTKDYPDFCDAYVCNAYWSDSGEELSIAELEALNDDRDFVYQQVINKVI